VWQFKNNNFSKCQELKPGEDFYPAEYILSAMAWAN
jgi:hypothetical protein